MIAGDALLSPAECAAVARRALQKSDVQVTSLDVRPYKEDGGVAGFMGSHFKLTLGVATVSAPLELFVKAAATEEGLHSSLLNELRCFDKEAVFYEQVLPELSVATPLTAVCYLARPGLLVLEDLALEGFSSIGCGAAGLDFQHVAVALEPLAGLHAASLALERRRGRPLDQLFPMQCQDISGPLTQAFFGVFKRASCVLCDLLPKYGAGSPHHDTIKALIPSTCDRLLRLVQPSDSHRNVLCHADVWVNNFMFRHDSKDGRPTEARLVDFQLTRYAPPALDVALFLHLVTSRDFRRERLEDALLHYHRRLAEELEKRGLVPEEELGWEQFRLSFDHLREAGIIVACMNHQICMIPSAAMQSLAGSLGSDEFATFWLRSRDELAVHFYRTDENYRHWVTQDLEEMIETCILPFVTTRDK